MFARPSHLLTTKKPLINLIKANLSTCTNPAIYEFPSDVFSQKSRTRGAIIFHVLIVLYMFYCLAIVCDLYFLPSLEECCQVFTPYFKIHLNLCISHLMTAPTLIRRCGRAVSHSLTNLFYLTQSKQFCVNRCYLYGGRLQCPRTIHCYIGSVYSKGWCGDGYYCWFCCFQHLIRDRTLLSIHRF